MSTGKTYRIGIDIGGTHTDLVVIDTNGSAQTYKVQSTPETLSEGVMDGLELAADDDDVALPTFLSDTDLLVHGTTITTNTLIEGTEAKTGLITTAGFRDVAELSMTRDEDLYDLYSEQKKPGTHILPRYLRRTVAERVDDDGTVQEPIDEAGVISELDYLENEGVDCIAVALMNSYLNDENEQRVNDILADRADVSARSVSSEILPRVGLYNRVTATVIDASLKSIFRDYIQHLDSRLSDNGFEGTFLVMKGNGGVSSSDVITEHPITAINSGPAAAVIGNAHTARAASYENVISIDMGGTSTDVSLIRDREPLTSTENTVGGKRVPIPMVDINTIGAGGGSIAWIDDRDVLRVGPESAGADPGPICYGQGNSRPTVTDATVLLGYLNPTYFLGGAMDLDVSRAREGIRETLADPLDLSVAEVAAGIYRLVNDQIVNQIRQVTVQRGYDHREFVLVMVGGAGPVHAGALARRLDNPVLVPSTAGTLSAVGLLQSDIKHDFVQSISPQPVSETVIDEINELFEELQERASQSLHRESISDDQWVFERTVGTRYSGQVHEVNIEVPSVPIRDVESLERRHHETHEQLYGFRDERSNVEIVEIKVTAIGLTDDFELGKASFTDPANAVKARRDVYFETESAYIETPIYSGEENLKGSFTGPGIVEFPHTTVVVYPDQKCRIDEFGNYVLNPESST